MAASDLKSLEDVLPSIEKERRKYWGRLSRQFVVIFEEYSAVVDLFTFAGLALKQRLSSVVWPELILVGRILYSFAYVGESQTRQFLSPPRNWRRSAEHASMHTVREVLDRAEAPKIPSHATRLPDRHPLAGHPLPPMYRRYGT